ncbi:hypothetical protein G3576_28505 [Roseomonas stagni]|uniref:histidine kinase n=1 Tax=Falsiroseomonas algicola TaxID=2716930 RepID=A0A6M1LVG0_9PROT|nr:sensor histidine kinase [Falsiroseomonas algicola]NGM23982.1 hypothetical protein [Falsiroseomonas algicola]
MSFTFAARTLLELGKELISSDEVALYELIKNSVDAKSPKIFISARIVFTRSILNGAISMLRDKDAKKSKSSLSLVEDVFHFVKSSLIETAPEEAKQVLLGRLSEATVSASRFEAELNASYIEENWIEVRDIGEGMSFEDLSKVFLRIGTRSRRADNIAGAQYLGDKGVGRLSAMRLGERLGVRTTRAGDTRWHLLDINWRLFSHDTDVDISDVKIKPTEGEFKKDQTAKGTRIRISDLTGDWNPDRFRDLLQGKIARMIDPFEAGLANKLLEVRHNENRILVPSVPPSLLSAAHASAHGKLYFDKEEPVLEGRVAYHRYAAERPINQRGAEIFSLAQEEIKRRGKRGHAAVRLVPIQPDALRALGPFSFDVYWYNRRVVEKVPDLTMNSSETRDQVAQWSGGPMLYRYGFRVLPYGEPQDDWLSLDVVAFGVSGFKLNRQQVIGRVRVWAPHTALSEQTNRQGLIDSDAASALRTIMMWVLHVELRTLINEVDAAEKVTKRNAEIKALAFRDTHQEVQDAVRALRERLDPSSQPLVARVASGVDELASQCAALVQRIDDAVKEVTSDREKFVYLAGIGLMTEFIFHELDRSVSHTLRLVSDSRKSLTASSLRALEDQLITLQKRISAFDDLTGERRQSKSTFDMADLVRDVLENHAGELARHGIKLHSKLPSLKVKAVRGMVIQILENLFANAIYWLKAQDRYQVGFHPQIWVELNISEKTLTVEDNGPGIAPERRELIFQPFITSKPASIGRGLGLYISRELAEYHEWQLYLDSAVGRHRKGRLSVFVLDMGG